MNNRIAKAVLIAVLVVGFYFGMQAGTDLGTLYFGTERGAANAAAAPTPVGASPALSAARVPTREVVATGVVVPANTLQLSLPRGGRVAEVLVAEGDSVEAGEVLVRLETTTLVLAVEQAEAELRRVQAKLDLLLAGARPEEIAAAQATVEAAQAQLAKVSRTARPAEVTAAEGALAAAQAALQQVQVGPAEEALIAARAELANAEAGLQQAQAAYDLVAWDPEISARPEALRLQEATNTYTAAKARYDLLLKGPGEASVAAAQAQVLSAQASLEALAAPDVTADIAAAQAELSRAQAQLALIQAYARAEDIAAAEADVDIAKVGLEQARLALAESELRAPVPGTVAMLDLMPGERIDPETTMVWLANLDSWQIQTADLTQFDVVNVAEGDRVSIAVEALPDVELTGTVARIRPIGENDQGDTMFTVLIDPDQRDPRLRWNMTTLVTIEPQVR